MTGGEQQIRRGQHHDRLTALHGELLGRVTGVLDGVEQGRVTPAEAVARIREATTANSTAVDALWDEFLGRDR